MSTQHKSPRRGAARADGLFLDLAIRETGPHAAAGEARIGGEHINAAGAVDPALLIAFGDRLAAFAAGASPAHATPSAAVETTLTVLGPAASATLVGAAAALRLGPLGAVWRASIRDSEGNAVAEVTQTRFSGAASAGATVAPMAPPAAREQAARDAGTAPAGTLSTIALERREQIFRGACDVIARKGFAGATVRDIAAAAGMPVPTMYLYIDSKEDLLSFIYEYFMEDINRRVMASVAPERTPTENLKSAIRANMAANDEYHRYIKLMFQETRALNAEGRRRVEILDGIHVSIWRRILEDGVKAGEFDVDDVELVANFIFYLCGVWALRYWSIGGHGFAAVTETISRFVLRAVGAPTR